MREEIVPFVIDDDERRKLLDIDSENRFHAELFVFDDLHVFDGLESENRRRPTDGAEIEASVLFTRYVTWRERLPFARVTKLPPCSMNGAT